MRNDLKTCTKCGVAKPATTEHFARYSALSCGLRPDCKECTRKQAREYGRAHADARRERGRIYYAAQADRIKERQRAYYERNRDVLLAKEMERRASRSPDARDQVLEYLRKYNAARSDAKTQKRREWVAARPEEARAQNRARKARRSGAVGTYTGNDIRAQMKRQRKRCFWCGGDAGSDYHVDHVMPIALGGSNNAENIVIACKRCNMRKSAKHPMDFAGVMF